MKSITSSNQTLSRKNLSTINNIQKQSSKNYFIDLLSLFILLLILSILFLNSILLYLSLIPLFTLILSFIIDNPEKILIKKNCSNLSMRAGDSIEVTLEITILDGLGIVTVYDNLPPHFKLLTGSNYTSLWKGIRKRTISLRYRAICTKRGVYTLNPTEWESKHPIWLKKTKRGDNNLSIEITVNPRIYKISRLRGRYTTTIPIAPIARIAKIGSQSTEFKEIRDYVFGDPMKNINWKASARRLKGGNPYLSVNEYEKEGRQTLWIFLNASYRLEIGTDINNPFEYIITATNAISYYFMHRNYRIGMYIYNNQSELMYPDIGKKQFHKIRQKLNTLMTYKKEENLDKAVRKSKRYLIEYDPLCMIVTCLHKENIEALMKGLRQLVKMKKRSRGQKLPIMVINILPFDLLTKGRPYDQHSYLLLNMKDRSLTKLINAIGVSSINWNPRKESFNSLILRQVRKR